MGQGEGTGEHGTRDTEGTRGQAGTGDMGGLGDTEGDMKWTRGLSPVSSCCLLSVLTVPSLSLDVPVMSLLSPWCPLSIPLVPVCPHNPRDIPCVSPPCPCCPRDVPLLSLDISGDVPPVTLMSS